MLFLLITQLLLSAFTASATNLPAPPDFVIVGTKKGGTTALRHNLNKHPNIFLPDNEVHYYDNERFQAGVLKNTTENYYRTLYELALKSGKKDIQVIGTGSPRYNDLTEVPYLMYADSPKTKIIFCLRDPVNRALSAYIMSCANENNHHPPSTEDFERRMHNAIQGSSYRLQDYTHKNIANTGMHSPAGGTLAEALYIIPILRFSTLFGRENILFVCNENTKGEDGKYSYHEVFDFLDVPRQDVDLNNYFEGNYENVSVSKTLRADMNKVFQPWNDELVSWLKATKHRTAQDTDRLVNCIQSWAKL